MSQTYYSYWGKAVRNAEGAFSHHLLPYHCLDVAAVGQALLSRDNSTQRGMERLLGGGDGYFLRWWMFCLALHDAGKFGEGFQNLIPELFLDLKGRSSSKGYAVRHDSLGYSLWKDHLCGQTWLDKRSGTSRDERQKRRWERIMDALILSAVGHHGTPPKSSGSNNLPIRARHHFEAEDLAAAQGFAQDASRLLLDGVELAEVLRPQKDPSAIKKASWLMAGFAVLCDWLASGYFQFVAKPMPLERYWQDYALPQADRALVESGVLPIAVSPGATPSSIFPTIEQFTPLQEHAALCPIDQEPHLIILEDVTGSGKTEAAIILAHRLMKEGHGNGIFIALPTMATSNSMYERLIVCYERLFETVKRPSLLLAHSARHLSKAFRQSLGDNYPKVQDQALVDESATAHCTSWLADNRKKALWADVGVGTLDQVLLSILPARFQSLRLAGLARRVLVVDEVHAYDPYMHELLRNLLSFHGALGGSAILLSATIPSSMRQQLVQSFAAGLGCSSPHLKRMDYPLVTHVSATGSVEVALSAAHSRKIEQAIELVHDLEEVQQRVVQAATSGCCVCWIRNTVHDALAAYEELQNFVPRERLILFHARFTMGDRLAVEQTVCRCFGRKSKAQNRSGMVLVATQVVEQSLDLDFDVLVSDLTPMELLIQRAGRLRRHPRDAMGNPLVDKGGIDLRPPEPFFIYTPVPLDDPGEDWYERTFPRAANIYPGHGRLWLAARILGEMRGWRMPEDARRLVEAVYSDEMEHMIPWPLLARDDQDAAKRSAERSLAHLNMLKLEEGYASTPNQWLDDTKTPTRLGELQTTLRLARWEAGELTPWHSNGDFPWDMSQVSVNAKLVHSEDWPKELELKAAIERVKSALADRGEWSVLVPLSRDENGRWRGTARGPKGELVVIKYETGTGLCVSRGGD